MNPIRRFLHFSTTIISAQALLIFLLCGCSEATKEDMLFAQKPPTPDTIKNRLSTPPHIFELPNAKGHASPTPPDKHLSKQTKVYQFPSPNKPKNNQVKPG